MNGNKSTDKPLTAVLSLSPEDCWGSGGPVKSGRLPQATQPANGRFWWAEVWTSLKDGRWEGRRTGCGSGELPLNLVRSSGLLRRAVGGSCEWVLQW